MNSAREIIKHFEGLKLESYKCPAGIWTVGWGHTSGVVKGDKITEKVVAIHIVNTNAVFDSYWDPCRTLHGIEAVDHMVGIFHQYRTKHSGLHPITGATAIKVDFVVMVSGGNTGRCFKFSGVTTTEL